MAKLKDELNKYSKEQQVKIGCKNRSLYIYCGNIEGFEKDCTRINGKILDKINRRVTNRKCDLDSAIKTTFEYSTDDVGYAEKVEQFIIAWYEKAEKLYKAYKTTLMSKAEFIPIQDREVVEIFDSISEKGVINILIEGYDVGEYWNKDEYENGVDKEDR